MGTTLDSDVGPGFGIGLAQAAAGFDGFLFVAVVGTGSVGVAGLGSLVALALASYRPGHSEGLLLLTSGV